MSSGVAACAEARTLEVQSDAPPANSPCARIAQTALGLAIFHLFHRGSACNVTGPGLSLERPSV